jgi:O-glycosyl hydrolase
VYAIGQFSRFIRPGAALLTATSTSSTLEATAAHNTSGTMALVLSNTSTSAATVTVTLANTSPPASVTPFRTSSTENQVQLSPISVTGGTFTITVPASSVVTVIG